MEQIENIHVRAEDDKVELNVQLLHQANQIYPQIENALPSGQLKDDLLDFIGEKREQYIKSITAKIRREGPCKTNQTFA